MAYPIFERVRLLLVLKRLCQVQLALLHRDIRKDVLELVLVFVLSQCE